MSASGNIPFTRAVGTVRLADEFVAAAKAHDLAKSPPPLVAHFLLGHALELAFKAVLILNGTTEKALRGLGHNLAQVRDAAVSAAPSGAIPLSDFDDARIDLLSSYYEAKALEYVEPGFVRLPNLGELCETAARAVQGILTYVEDRVRKDLRAGRAV